MKRILLGTLLATFLAAPVLAQGIRFNIKNLSPQQSQALQQLIGPIATAPAEFEQCVNAKLGADGMQRVTSEAKIMNKEIVALCKAGRAQEARKTAELYAGTIEGEAAWACGRGMREYLNDPSVQKLLGAYFPMAQELANGRLPSNVCGTIKAQP